MYFSNEFYLVRVNYVCCRGSKTGHLLFELRSHPVAIKRASKMIVVACMDETLQCYNVKVCIFYFCLITPVSKQRNSPFPLLFSSVGYRPSIKLAYSALYHSYAAASSLG